MSKYKNIQTTAEDFLVHHEVFLRLQDEATEADERAYIQILDRIESCKSRGSTKKAKLYQEAKKERNRYTSLLMGFPSLLCACYQQVEELKEWSGEPSDRDMIIRNCVDITSWRVTGLPSAPDTKILFSDYCDLFTEKE